MAVSSFDERALDGLGVSVAHAESFLDYINSIRLLANANEALGAAHETRHGEGGADPLSSLPALAVLGATAVTVADVAAYVVDFSAPLMFRGTVALDTDFPALAAVDSGDVYRVTAQCGDTDPGGCLTNQEFQTGDEIAWNGTNWSILGAGAAALDRSIYVDGASGNDAFEGTESHPFATINAAVAAAALLTPTAANPVAIYIAAGAYDEAVLIHGDLDFSGLYLIGQGQGVNVNAVTAATSPSLMVTDATEASVATFIASGGMADPTTHWGDLAAGAQPMSLGVIQNINFGQAAGGNEVMLLGVGAGSVQFATGISLLECVVRDDLYARGGNLHRLDRSQIAGDLAHHNVTQITSWRSDVFGNVFSSYDVADDEPADASNNGFLSGGRSTIGVNWELSGSVGAGGVGSNSLHLSGDLDLDDTAQLVIDMPFVGGNTDVEGDAALAVGNPYFLGDVTLVNAGGAIPCLFAGGSIQGTLTDVGGRLTFGGGFVGLVAVDANSTIGIGGTTLANLESDNAYTYGEVSALTTAPTLTPAAEVADVIAVAFASPVASVEQYMVEAFDPATMQVNTAAFSIAETGVGAEVSPTAMGRLIFTTDASGAATLSVTDVAGASSKTAWLRFTPLFDSADVASQCAPAEVSITFDAV